MAATSPAVYPAATENGTEDDEESLAAYYEACRAASSSASSSAEDDDEKGGAENLRFGTTHQQRPSSTLTSRAPPGQGSVREGASQLSPLQGSAPYPLLQRQRRGSAVGVDASSPLHDPATALPLAVRGIAGAALAKQLQHATLPLASTDAGLPHADGMIRVAATSTAFEFHLPSEHSSSALQSASVKGKRKATTTTTITTRGRSSRSPSSLSPDSPVTQHHARQRAVLFDVLCALRQHPTASCEATVPEGEGQGNAAPAQRCAVPFAKTWRLTASAKAEAHAQRWPLCFLGCLEQLLRIADIVAAVEAQLGCLERVCSACNDAAAATVAAGSVPAYSAGTAEVQDASAALEATGQAALQRFARVLQQLSADFLQWVLQVQDFLLALCEGAFGCDQRGDGGDGCSSSSSPTWPYHASDLRSGLHSSWFENEERGGGEVSLYADSTTAGSTRRGATSDREALMWQSRCSDGAEEDAAPSTQDGLLPPSCSLMAVVLAVQENSIPLQRCRVLVEESGCFDGLAESPSEMESATPFAVLAARLLDTLIIQASAAQDTSTMDLYRFYVMLLLYTAWPYVLLCTAAIFGFVRGIDPPVWRRQLPRVFRSSFSHVRVGDAQRQYPTDVLSLILNCVGYYNSSEVLSDGGKAGLPAGGGSPQPHWQPAGGDCRVSGSTGAHSDHRRHLSRSRHGGLRADLSEHHVALAALASARTFVLHSLANFTRRKKQVALSRTPASVRPSAVTEPEKMKRERNVSKGRVEGGRAALPTAPSAPHWQQKSVKEILHYILYESGGRQRNEEQYQEEGEAGGEGSASGAVDVPRQDVGTTVVAYAQQNQDVRRRVVQLPDRNDTVTTTTTAATAATDMGAAGVCATLPRLTRDGQHYLYYPTTIPLGFTTMMREALPGQQRWQLEQQQQQQEGDGVAGLMGAETDALLPLSAATSSLRSVLRLSRGDDNEREGAAGGGGSSGSRSGTHTDPPQCRALSLWTLCISESATAPDVLFMNANAPVDDEIMSGWGDLRRWKKDDVRYSRHHHLHQQQWINVTVPCARWVTTALLIPIGVAVQRLQERRLRDLLTISLHAVQPCQSLAAVATRRSRDGDGSGLLWRNDIHIETVGPGEEKKRGSEGGFRKERVSPALTDPPGFSPFFPMTREMWGVRNSTTAACSFLHALKLVIDVALCRDQERLVFGFLEHLYREPRWWARRWVDGGAAAFERVGTAAPTVTALFADALRGKRLGELVRLVVLPAKEIRKEQPSTVAAVAAMPTDTADATAAAAPASTIAADMLDMFASFQLEFTFPGAFALILQPRDLSVYVQPVTGTTERSYQTFFWQRRRRLYVEEPVTPAAATSTAAGAAAVAGVTRQDGVVFADVWSYVFGYQCSLYYAQITLREHKKQLRQRDTHDFQVAHTMGQPGPRVARHLQYVSRGLGSAYYTLNFAVDTLLSFMQAEAMRTVYDVEHLLQTALRASPGLHSCMELCQQLDTLLLQLHFVSFPARPAVALNSRERAMQSPATEAVRSAVQQILAIALDPARLPVSYISSSTRNAVEALVAAVTAASGERSSGLAFRLHPLRVMLTFNAYYGTAEETLSFRFR
jgi:hypothetical protein